MPHAYYNEIDPYAAQWLRNLIRTHQITDGEVDERPIQNVHPSDLKPFTRCHFFAGIAGWDIALRQANYPPDKPVWTGSCPCQPFSTAGARRGFADERHLWPFWFHLISVRRPPVIFGEQVANGSGPWLDLVLADLESADYAVGAAVLPAAGVGAPHIRDRVWFVAHSSLELGKRSGHLGSTGRSEFADRGTDIADSNSQGSPLRREPQLLGQRAPAVGSDWWSVEPRLGRVVDGFPTRAQRLRAYGNAIVPQVAAEFIKAALPHISHR